MQAIETKYHGSTNHRPSRISANCVSGKITIPWNYGMNVWDNHVAAANALCDKLAKRDKREYGPESKSAWNRDFLTGERRNSYVHVFTERPASA